MMLVEQGGDRQDICLAWRLRRRHARQRDQKGAKYTHKSFHSSLQRVHNSWPGGDFAGRMAAGRRTKAQVQLAKEEVLDSEDGDAAGRRTWRRVSRSSGSCSSDVRRRLEKELMRHNSQMPQEIRGVKRGRGNHWVLPMQLAACAVRRHFDWTAISGHPLAACGLCHRIWGERTRDHRHCGPNDRNDQHQQRVFFAPFMIQGSSESIVSIRRRPVCGSDQDHILES